MASQPPASSSWPNLPAEFITFLETEAQNARDASLDDARAAAIRAYNGDPYGDEVDGRSQVVTRDVSEVVDFMLTGVLGTVMAGGKAVEFETEPDVIEGPPDQNGQPSQKKVDYGAQATAAVRYQFFRKQPGYRILHDAGKAGMVEKTGIGKTYAKPVKSVQQRKIVPRAAIEEQGGGLVVGGVRVVEVNPLPEEEQPPLPPPVQMMQPTGGMVAIQEPRPEGEVLHEVVVEIPQQPLIRDDAVPNEWFLVSPDTVNLDESPYVGECTPKSISQLVAMGYDYGLLEKLWGNAPADTVVSYARDADRSNSQRTIGRREGAQRLLWFYEEYPLYDLDGDAISERLFVHRIGRQILRCEPIDEQPYSGWSPVPLQHRFTGQSIADKTQDIQRVRSVLQRQGLDSLYIGNAPRTLLPDSAVGPDTIDDLLTVRPYGIIRYTGQAAPTPFETTDVSGVAFQAMEVMSAERESRTGVTRQSQGLNPDTMNKTASGMAMLQANSDQFELYVTRNFVEGLVASMFAKRYRLMKAHKLPFRMKIDGVYQDIDPSRWPDEADIQINVGIGTGTKDQRVAALGQLMATQVEARSNGIRWVTDDDMFNAAQQWIEDTGLGAPSRFITDPATLPPAPDPAQQPSPDAIKAQGDAQLSQLQASQAHQQAMAKLQLQQEAQQASAALDEQKNAQDLQAKREKAALDIRLATQKADFEAQLARQQQAFEMDLAERRFAFDQEIARRKNQQADENDAGLTQYREGGSLAE